MFNPKLTRGCCWARGASWESFVWELFGNEYEHWAIEVVEKQEAKTSHARNLPGGSSDRSSFQRR